MIVFLLVLLWGFQMNTLSKSPEYTLGNMRTIVRELQRTAQISLQIGEHYRLDRLNPFSYLDAFPRWHETIANYLRSLGQQGKSVVFADICGRASIPWVQANYSFSLQPIDFRSRLIGTTSVEGDIFARHDFPRFIDLIAGQGHLPAWVTFNPVAGLQGYYLPKDIALAELHHAIVYKRLAQHLELLIRVLRPGGYVFLGRPFSFMYAREFLCRVPQEKYAACLWAKDFCRQHHCSLQIGPSMSGPYWLIRKWLR